MKKIKLPTQWVELMRRRWVMIGLAVLIGLGGGLGWMLTPKPRHVSVTGLGGTIEFQTREKDLAAALKAHGITVGPNDRVTPSLDTTLRDKQQITVHIQKAVPVHVLVDGKSIDTESAAPSVGDLLADLSVVLGPKDVVSVDTAAAVVADMEIQIVRRAERVDISQEEIPFDLVRQEDRSMMAGETREIQSGAPGLKEVKRITYLEDGNEVGSEVVEENVLKEPVSRIVAYGTGGVVSRGGRDYRYSRRLVLTATGYTAGLESNPQGNGYTYTGMRAEYGVVAVDPRVIPLYTRLYIEGYGPAIAADIGGAIQGNRIDLCFNSLAEARAFGVRPVTVYVLGE